MAGGGRCRWREPLDRAVSISSKKPALAAAAIVLLGLSRLDRARQHAEKLVAQQIGLAGSRQSKAPARIKVSTQPAPDVPGRDPFEEVVEAR